MKLSEIKQQGKYTSLLSDYYTVPVIYKLTFANGKIYIGQTNNLKRRLYNYMTTSNTSKHFVKSAILKYGLGNVEISILCECNSQEQLDDKEKYYISLFDSCNRKKGYNLDYGGKGGVPSSQTILKKIQSSKKVKVGQYDLEGKLIKIFNSVKEASRTLDISDSDIHRSCKNKGSRDGYLFSKVITEQIKSLHYKKQKGRWNLKTYKVTNIFTSEIIVIEGLENVADYLKCSKKYLNNIIKRKTIYNKQFKIEKHES